MEFKDSQLSSSLVSISKSQLLMRVEEMQIQSLTMQLTKLGQRLEREERVVQLQTKTKKVNRRNHLNNNKTNLQAQAIKM
jgi:hypothetical protein